MLYKKIEIDISTNVEHSEPQKQKWKHQHQYQHQHHRRSSMNVGNLAMERLGILFTWFLKMAICTQLSTTVTKQHAKQF
jgi:hypothetical protein